ncbi:MAG: hypothetical protein COA56_14120 [Dehalococcoidia bacterium]|nr:MAG: hypothetical protein COA56_14120 [Dehalococcoidia bacterium]
MIAAWTGPERFPPTLLYGRLNMPKRMLMNAFSGMMQGFQGHNPHKASIFINDNREMFAAGFKGLQLVI